MYPFIQLGNPGRQNRRDKMYVMSPLCKVAPEFRADYTAAAVGRINRDPNIHQL